MGEDEDLNVDGSESDSNDGFIGAKPPTQSVTGPNGFREFIMIPLWTINDFNSSIKQTHFNTLREKYQIPANMLICLPFKHEKCYYRGLEDVDVYKQMLKVGLRFPLSAFHRCLLQYLGLSVTQISPNAWRVFLEAEVLYGVMFDGAQRMKVEEFFHFYHLSEITQLWGMYSFMPKSLLLRLVCDTPNSNRSWKSRYFMCHLGEQEHMAVDKTWDIIPPFGMYPFVSSLHLLVFISSDILTVFVSSLGSSISHP